MENKFIETNILGAGANNTMTLNGAVSYYTFGSEMVDQFGRAGSYMCRSIEDVWADQSKLWAENPEWAVRFPFYLRMITRKTKVNKNNAFSKIQKGSGLRDESIKRLLWIATYHPESFYKNLWLLPVVGSWKDLWTLLYLDTKGTIDVQAIYNVIAMGIMDGYHIDLIKKYLPRIRANSKCTTDWSKKTNSLARGLAKYFGWDFKAYRMFKSTGKAHEFQRDICAGKYSSIDWAKIPGKALMNMVNGKFMAKHKLENLYLDWIEKQAAVNFNGYPYELAKALRGYRHGDFASRISILTADKQFNKLIETAKTGNSGLEGNVLCALDTSGSMGMSVAGDVTAYDVCLSLGVYFSELNQGAFHNTVAMFDDVSTLKVLKGSFSEKMIDLFTSTIAWGSTNFQSIIDLLCNTRTKNADIPISDYPTTILVVSDMQFNNCGEKTNYELAKEKLSSVFPMEYVDNLKFIWWNVNPRQNDSPVTEKHKNTFLMSGFDGASISFILGGEETTPTKEKRDKSMYDVINDALSQEVLLLIEK